MHSEYNSRAYHEQGGDRIVIAPGGELLLEGVVRGLVAGSNFFVNSATGSDDNDGLSWASALATIDAAVNKCTASQGDVIWVAPAHTEDLTAADSIDCDVAGIAIIGLGDGNLIPTLTATAAAGALKVDAANVRIENIRLVANFATGCTKAIDITASGDGCTLVGVQFRDTTTDKEWLIHIAVATTVSDLHIKNCSFVGLAGTMSNSILFAGTSSDCVIEDSYFFVDSSDDVIDHLAGASVNLVVRRCVIVNADTDAAGYCLRYKSDGTGVAHNNFFAYNKVDAEISVGAAAWWFQNYASNTIAESGRLDPTTSHAIP